MKALNSVVSVVLATLWVFVMIGTPLLAAWLATALVSFHGGSRRVALSSGVLLFPVLPVLWEVYAIHAWRKTGSKKKQFLTTLDRLVLRTLTISGAFVFVLLSWHPKTAFAALATRGDWFIAGQKGSWAGRVRGTLLSVAQGLEWLHELANPNPYRKASDDRPIPTSVRPNDPRPPTKVPVQPKKPSPKPETEQEPEKAPSADQREQPPAFGPGHWPVGETSWPFPNAVHPAVLSLTDTDEATPESLAIAIAKNETDPFLRVKALHDWAVTRLRYDVPAPTKPRGPQDARSVFANRRAVCEGYARLLVELGRLTGDRIEYVTGEVREETGELAPVGHAWNAVEIHGAWYLLDATWDDPVSDANEKENYSTTYLFIPPSLAGLDHYPDKKDWQLRSDPLRRTDFLRQPLARPSLAREGLTLVRPERPAVEVEDSLEVILDNPLRRFVMLTVDGEKCALDDGLRLTLRCSVPGRERMKALLFANTRREGTYQSVAAMDVMRR